MRKIFGLFILAACSAGAAQAPSYQLTGGQLAQLKRDQKRVERLYAEKQKADENFQAAETDMEGDAERIKQANGWPASLMFRPDTLVFFEAPNRVPATGPVLPQPGVSSGPAVNGPGNHR